MFVRENPDGKKKTSDAIYYSESFTETKFHVKYFNTVKSKVRYVFSKLIECLEQNIRKQIDCKRASSKKMQLVSTSNIAFSTFDLKKHLTNK